MPDDDWALGQNEVDVRNEARRPANAMPMRWIAEAPEDRRDLAEALDHQRRLHEAVPVSPEADLRRQEALARNLREIQRLMGS